MSDFEFTPFAAAKVKVELEEWDHNAEEEESILNFSQNICSTNHVSSPGIGNCEEKVELEAEGNITFQEGLADDDETEDESIEETHTVYIKSEPEEIGDIDYMEHPLGNIHQGGEYDDAGHAHMSNTDPLRTGGEERNSDAHIEEKPFSCDICGKTFSLKAYLTKHKWCHADDKAYKCDTCEKSFRSSRYLTKHMRCHKTDKCYKCEICGKVFIRVDNLKQHSRVHLQDKQRPTFNCELCDKSYVSLRRLNDHMIFHTGQHLYKCDTCGKGFCGSESLAQHKLCHLDENDKFKCETCGKSFARSYNYNVHLKLHAGEKPFVCDACGKSYVSRNRLTRHQNTTCSPHQNRLASVMGIELNETPTPTPPVSSSVGLDLTLN